MRTRVRTPGRLARAAGVPDPRPRRGADRGGRGRRASPTARPSPEVARGDRRGRGGDRRPVEPGDLDRPDPRGARDARGDRRRARARWSRSARSSAGARVKGPTEAFIAARRAARERRRRRLALRRGCSTGSSSTTAIPDPGPEGSRCSSCPTLMEGRDRPPGAGRAGARVRPRPARARSSRRDARPRSSR